MQNKKQDKTIFKKLINSNVLNDLNFEIVVNFGSLLAILLIYKEDIIRLIVIAIGIPIFLTKGIEYAVAFIVLSNIISEITSIIVLFFFLPKNFKLEKKDFVPNNCIFNIVCSLFE